MFFVVTVGLLLNFGRVVCDDSGVVVELLVLPFFWEPSRCVIQYKYKLKDYSIQSKHNKQIIYYQSINLATCFGSWSHYQTNSQTILKVH